MLARRILLVSIISTAVMCVAAGPPLAPKKRDPRAARAPMTDGHLNNLIKRIDPEAQVRDNVRQLTLEGRKVLVISDAAADRMRIMTPVGPAKDLDAAVLQRMLQANFDAVLDARYAIARDMVWSTFIHPLSPLTEKEFYSGLAQVVVAAETYGTAFTSGALVFGGGDTNALNRKLYERLLKKGKQKI